MPRAGACYFPPVSATPYEPELGQLLFGNASGALDLGADEHYVAERLYALSERLGRLDPANQAHGLLGGEWGYGQEFSNEVFEMHPYWWGGCTCGFEALDCRWSEDHPHTPQCFQSRYLLEDERLSLDDVDFDERHARMIAWAKANGYPEAPYGMAVHCDCGMDWAYQQWRKEHDHAADCREVIPNFKCGDLEIRWYKYLGRGMSVNREVTRAEWKEIFRRCFASLPEPA